MFDVIIEMFSYPFVVRAMITGILVSLSAALLGVPLVLKRYSMIGDGLSHIGFGALAVAAAMNWAPLAVSVPVVVVSAFFLLKLGQNSKTNGDAAVALISTGALALGVMVVSISGTNTDVVNYMFGSILAMSETDVKISVILSVAVILIYFLFYPKIFSITFDESFAKATGIKVGFSNMLIAFLTAITIVVGMRLVGSMLISALIIFPSLSSMRVFKSFRSVVISSAIIAVCCFFVGMVVSYVCDTPAGASVVCVNIIVYIAFVIAGSFMDRAKR